MKIFNDNELIDARNVISDVIKMLVYKENPKIFNKLDFDNEDIFLEPLLFSYFNSTVKHSFTLEQILFGYINESERNEIFFHFDENGRAYFPKIGYFHIDIEFRFIEKYKIKYVNNTYQIFYNEKIIKFTLEVLDNIDIYCLHKYPIDIFDTLFHEYDEYNPNNIETLAKVEIIKTAKYHKENFDLALNTIKIFLPDLYSQLKLTNSDAVIYFNTKVQCFQATSALGSIFISAQEFNNFIFFIEEIIHQGSHNILEYVMFNKLDFFISDPLHISISKYSPNESLNRSIYSAFHGLYTVLQRVIYYKELIEKGFLDKLSKEQQHEFVGRFCDQKRRFRTGLQFIILDEVYTEKGKQLYIKMDSICENGLYFIEKIINQFDMSNQQLEFRYSKFSELNPIEDFNYSSIISKLLSNDPT